MPYSQYLRWMDYERLEPYGQPWQNWLMAVPASMYSQVHSQKGRVVRMSDFMYEDEQSKKERQNAEFFHFLDSFEPKQ